MKEQTDRIGIYGVSGCGKSFLTKELIKNMDRVSVFDSMIEYNDADFIKVNNVIELLKAVKKPCFKVAYQINVSNRYQEELAKVAEAVFLIQKPYKEEKNNRQITFVIEEMSLSLPNIQNSKSSFIMVNMANMGRHYGINIIGTAQRPANINTTVRACFNENYFFRMNILNDIQAVAEFIGKNNANKLLSFNTHEAIHYKNGSILKYQGLV